MAVYKSGKFSRISCTSASTNSKFELRFQKMAESRDLDAVKVYQGDYFEGVALRNGSEADRLWVH
jgi:hypothetical protein